MDMSTCTTDVVGHSTSDLVTTPGALYVSLHACPHSRRDVAFATDCVSVRLLCLCGRDALERGRGGEGGSSFKSVPVSDNVSCAR